MNFGYTITMAQKITEIKLIIYKTFSNYRTLTYLVVISLFLFAVVQKYYFRPYISAGNLSPSNPYGANGVQRLPHAIIAGVMKSGTRATINYLILHPDVCIAKGEVRFFNQYSAYRKGYDFYRSQMPYSDRTRRQVTIEKSPEYFEHAQTPERIKQMNSSVKIVLIMRDPITRAVSDYSRTQRAIAAWGLDTSFVSFESLATPWLLGRRVWQSFPPVRRSVYIRDLQRWYDHFPAHQIHLVDGERLISDPYMEMSKLEAFLGVRHYFKPSNFAKSEGEKFPCKQKNDGRKRCLGEGKGHVYKPLGDKTRSRLKEFYEPYNQRVYQLVGQDFNWKNMNS